MPGKTSAAHWLKGSTLATLSLGVQGIEHLLTIYIRDQALIQCSSVLCTILSPEDTGQGWVLLGAPTSSEPYQVVSHAHVVEVSRLAASSQDHAIVLIGCAVQHKSLRQQHADDVVSLATQARAFAFNFAPAEAGRHCQRVIEVRAIHQNWYTELYCPTPGILLYCSLPSLWQGRKSRS